VDHRPFVRRKIPRPGRQRAGWRRWLPDLTEGLRLNHIGFRARERFAGRDQPVSPARGPIAADEGRSENLGRGSTSQFTERTF